MFVLHLFGLETNLNMFFAMKFDNTIYFFSVRRAMLLRNRLLFTTSKSSSSSSVKLGDEFKKSIEQLCERAEAMLVSAGDIFCCFLNFLFA